MSAIRSVALCAHLLVLAAGAASAGAQAAQPDAQAARACLAAATTAEREHGLPRGLLAAIGVVESGLDPWAISGVPAARRPASRREAMALASRGANHGCFQINVRVHRAGEPGWAFDARRSARFAARLLRDLRERHGGWTAAVARYNGATQSSNAGLRYRCRLAGALAALPEADRSVVQASACGGLDVEHARRAKAHLAVAGVRPRGAPAEG